MACSRILENIGSKATGRKFLGSVLSSFLCKGTILAHFQELGKHLVLIDRLTMCVMTGNNCSFPNFKTVASISSTPHDLLDFNLEIILSISSGWRHFKKKEQSDPRIRFLTSCNGSPWFTGRLLCNVFTLLMKNCFMVLLRSDGLVYSVPFTLHPSTYSRGWSLTWKKLFLLHS